MEGEARNPNDPAESPTAPHPILTKYYQSEKERRPFVSALFDDAAEHYDWVCALGSFGSGQRYRRVVLLRSGLCAGMKLLDVATGTGLGARSAARILREPGGVIGHDSRGGQVPGARPALPIPLVQGTAPEQPVSHDHFDLLHLA